ncbi:MAG TPA: AgmX/PglI C-terminal domain-containing protein, partial [Polyangiaceae bacterium]|nr:AgmX/PglI C-terminal domain-containing protein [Polyangiaceae bacterium]
MLGGCAVARPPASPLVVDAQEDEPGVASEWDREPSLLAAEVQSAKADDEGADAWPEFLRELVPSLSPSLLGTVVAHVPGQDGVTAGVSFGRVRVTAKVDAGFAYTEVEEELVNDGSSQLEAIASFRAPAGGVIARMALWVDDRWIEAEVVERKRAAEVYEGIVERRRDPALLEQDPSGLVRLRVFPVPAHGARRVVVGYAQPLERQEGRYHFELGLRLPEGMPSVRELSTEVELAGVGAEQLALLPSQPVALVEPGLKGTRVRWEGTRIRPPDWRLSFAAPQEQLTTFAPLTAKGRERFVALRLTPDLPFKVPEREASVWLIDTSVGQRDAALDVSKAIVTKLLKQLPTGDRFAILACDTACASFPGRGLLPATSDSRKDAQRFVAGLEARGASDIGYALFEALQRTQGRARAQLVYFGDARPTAGDLHVDEIVERLAERGELLDLRLVGVGPALDAGSLTELAARVTAARTSVGGDTDDAERIARWLARPVLRAPSLQLPSAFESAYPRQLPNLVRGDELLVLARLGRQPAGALRGELSGELDNGVGLETRRSQLGLDLPGRELRADSAPRLWARARLRDLDDDEAPATYEESVELSTRYQVLSRHTSFLALESNAMFRALGIEQRFGRADFGRTPVVPPPPPRAVPQDSRPHRVRAPVIRMAFSVVSGRLPPESIQETVRRNDGRFRACYHEGLLKNPKLEGAVTTRFLIGRDGTVVASMDSGSTLADRAVIACIVSTFKTLVFPVPDGTVTVVYPFLLSPSTAKEQRTLRAPWTSRSEAPRAVLAPAPVPPEPSAPAPRVSAAELAAQVELEPTNVQLQLLTAQAYEAERGERRACAHFRAAAALAPRDLETQYQALRCRA